MLDSETSPWWTDAYEDQVLHGVVDRAIFERFSETHGYGAATPLSWLGGQLTVLLGRLRGGHRLSLYTPTCELEVDSEAEFRAWAARYFPDARV